jgi:hypothetical protein
MILNKIKKQRKGMAAILTVIIISAATLIMAYSASILGIGDLELSYVSNKANEALILADGCMEEVFRRVLIDNDYIVTNYSLSVEDNHCIIYISGDSSSKLITVSGFVDDYSKKVQAEISIFANVITVNSWDEISS